MHGIEGAGYKFDAIESFWRGHAYLLSALQK
jgi:hypothetical protein